MKPYKKLNLISWPLNVEINDEYLENICNLIDNGNGYNLVSTNFEILNIMKNLDHIYFELMCHIQLDIKQKIEDCVWVYDFRLMIYQIGKQH